MYTEIFMSAENLFGKYAGFRKWIASPIVARIPIKVLTKYKMTWDMTIILQKHRIHRKPGGCFIKQVYRTSQAYLSFEPNQLTISQD